MTTLPQWLDPAMGADETAPAQRFLAPSGWTSRTYGELHDLVRRTAAVLISQGATPERPIAIIAQTRPEWTIVDLAAASIGVPTVPVYPTSSPRQIEELLRRLDIGVTVGDRDDLADVEGTGVLLRLGTNAGDLGDLARGPLDDAEDEMLRDLEAAVRSDDVFSIIFSSGSTGAPKGCVLTHANYVAVLKMATSVETSGPDGAAHRAHAFVYLPLAHVSARLQQLTTLSVGGELVYGSGSTPELLDQIAATRPTYVPGVPRFFESAYVRADRDPGRLRAMFGDRLGYALTGGAPIDPAMLATYRAAGITLVEGYGLTETAAALTLCAPHANREGSVGRALPGVTLRLADDGELLARGPNVFQGYLDDESATADAFTDGWFRTGDLATIDEDGFVYITGRKKNLIVTSTGKNVAPEPIENRMRTVLGIADVAVVGDRYPYLIALIFGADESGADSLVAGIRALNDDVAPPERIRKIVLVPTPLDPARGEVTASGKLMRPTVLDHHRDLIAAVYDGREPDVPVLDTAERPSRTAA
jgi:long-chain acyl-CoA synthetase